MLRSILASDTHGPMVFFNYATMQMAAKIVYYGPGLCGKTTNLHHIYNKTSSQSRGEMVSLETETDRTLFFDLLPLEVGVIGGFRTRLQLYTVPGQVFYNTTRKLVLKGADGVVFVADSQPLMLEANIDSFRNLRQNLEEIGLRFDELPVVIQLNKRDLPSVIPKDEMLHALDPGEQYEWQEASALRGDGVFETLKKISKLTLRSLRRRMMGDDTVTPPPSRAMFTVAAAQRPPAPPAGPAPIAGEEGIPAPVPPPQASPAAPIATGPAFTKPAERRAPAGVVETQQHGTSAEPSSTSPTDEPPSVSGDEVVTERFPPLAAEPLAEAALETGPPETFLAPDAPEEQRPEDGVKRVRVRSSVDIMAELEALRKKATGVGRDRKETGAESARREMHRTVELTAGEPAQQARSLRIVLAFQDETGAPLEEQERELDLEGLADLQRLMLNLRVDFDSDSD